jgi:hypothetical protein
VMFERARKSMLSPACSHRYTCPTRFEAVRDRRSDGNEHEYQLPVEGAERNDEGSEQEQRTSDVAMEASAAPRVHDVYSAHHEERRNPQHGT